MDLNEIVVFAKVVETKSFTVAAHQLGLPKSTVSRKVAQLEERLGTRLLQRTTRKLGLTEQGAAYYQRCQRIVSEIQEAEQMVTDMQSSPRGLLRVSAPVDLGVFVLGDVVARFAARFADIDVQIDLTDRMVDLVEERFDVGIRIGPLVESSLIARRLCSGTARLFSSAGYLEKRGTPHHPEELDDHSLISFVPVPRMATWHLEGPTGVIEITPGGHLVSNSLGLVREAVRAGSGIALVPEFAIGAPRRTDLVAVLPEWSSSPYEIHAVYPSTRNQSSKLRAFVDFLVEAFNPPPWSPA